jgi:toxin ParE1/3/4
MSSWIGILAMSHKVLLRPAAGRDLDAIAVYTKKQWGARQAQLYVAALRADIETLADFPMRHELLHIDGSHFRKLSSGHHLVFYVVEAYTVSVVRILHERMDIDRHL